MKIIISIICCILFISCSNDNPVSPPSPDVPLNTEVLHPDTLTTGWSRDSISGKPLISDIFFANNLIGYLCEEAGIWRTSDGGNTWVKVSNIRGGLNLSCTPEGKVFMVGNSSKVYFSNNDGATFDSLDLGSTQQLHDVYFTDNNNGFILGDNSLFRTTNAGVSWNSIEPLTGSPFITSPYSSMFFLNPGTGWTGTYSNVFHSVSSIYNWEISASYGTQITEGFTAIYATGLNNVFAISFHGKLYKSIDGGLNFVLRTTFNSSLPDITDDFSDVHFIDNNTGYVSYGRKIYKTTDGGTTWQTVVSLGNNRLLEIHFTDAGHGWACGDSGTVVIYRP